MSSTESTWQPVLNIGEQFTLQVLNQITDKDELAATLEVLQEPQVMRFFELVRGVAALNMVTIMRMDSVPDDVVMHSRIQMCTLLSIVEAIGTQAALGHEHPLLNRDENDNGVVA